MWRGVVVERVKERRSSCGAGRTQVGGSPGVRVCKQTRFGEESEGVSQSPEAGKREEASNPWNTCGEGRRLEGGGYCTGNTREPVSEKGRSTSCAASPKAGNAPAASRCECGWREKGWKAKCMIDLAVGQPLRFQVVKKSGGRCKRNRLTVNLPHTAAPHGRCLTNKEGREENHDNTETLDYSAGDA